MCDKDQRCRHIVQLTSSNYPFGGPDANVLRLLTIGLRKNNRNVHVIIQRGRYFRRNPEVKRKGIVEGVTYSYCGFSNRPKYFFLKVIDSLLGAFLPSLILLLKKIKGQVDCVLCYTGSALELVPSLLCCKLCSIPIINHVVEWYDKDMIVTSKLRLLKWWDFLFRMKNLNVYFDGLIVTSYFLKEYYVNRNVTNIMILPNLLDITPFSGQYDISRQRKKQIRIGYCGFPTRKDGINDLLQAFTIVHDNFPTSELLVVGDTAGARSLLPGLREYAARLGIIDNVTFTGLVTWDMIPGLLRSCDILVLARPSGVFADAGFPTKLGEYMACRKPVVATRVGDIGRYLDDGKNIVFAEPDNPVSVASKILALVENPEYARNIGENGFVWAKEKLDYIAGAKSVNDFINSI